MEKYESHQVRILRPAAVIYRTLPDFSNFTPILQDKVEEWQADADSCSFKVKGFTARLRIVEREENKLVKVTGDEGSPFPFFFWLQLHPVDDTDTRMRLVLHIELNMMMKMMIGGKIREAMDQIADKIAESFNNAPI